MRHLLYYIAAFMIVVWSILIVIHVASFLIHTLIVVAAIIIIVRVAQGKKLIE